MKKTFPVFITAVSVVAMVIAGPVMADSVIDLFDSPLLIENDSSENALTLTQSSTVSKGRSSGGALLIDNTRNMNTGLTLYTNADSSVSQPLARFEIDNESWDEEVLYIHSDSPTSRGLIRLDSPAPEIEFVETDQGGGAAGKFEIRVQHDAFQFNSRRGDDTTFENKMSLTHDGDLVLRDGTIHTSGDEPATFRGGINITGGCIAIDGVCMGEESTAARTTAAAPEQSEMKLSDTDGTPTSIKCNSYTERGEMSLDVQNNRLYICNGPERGWDYVNLND